VRDADWGKKHAFIAPIDLPSEPLSPLPLHAAGFKPASAPSAKHISPPTQMHMRVRLTAQLSIEYNACRTRKKAMPQLPLKMTALAPVLYSQDWDEWGISSSVSSFTTAVNSLTSEADVTGTSSASKRKVAANGGAPGISPKVRPSLYTPSLSPSQAVRARNINLF
jgi:hypothetical protein